MRAAVRTTFAALLLFVVAACQQIPPAPPPTKPAEPPPPVAAPAAPVVQEPIAPPVTVAPRSVKAALLVPLSGQAAAVGQHLSNAAQLALFEVGGGNFSLQPFDTKGTPEGAEAAARQAIAQGASVILGPVFSAETKAVAPVARQAGVSVVAFTTDRGAAGNGVWILGFLPRSQVARVVGYARAQGMMRFAVLAPDNDYGRAMADAAKEVVAGSGGLLTRVAFYDTKAKDPSAAIQQLMAGGPEPFEALLIPDEGARLKAAAAMLALNGVDLQRVQLLGTMLWDDPTLATEPALVGGWYPAPPQAAHADFVRSYQAAFAAKPPAIASLGYDATALAAVLGQRPASEYGGAALTEPSGFAGVDGIFRLLPDGTNQRGLAVMTVNRAGAQEIAPAPETFSGPVF